MPRKMRGERSVELMGGGEMDEAVSGIVGGAGEMSFALRLFEGDLAQDFIDRLGHGSRPRH